ncbi:hypothetical protein ACOME3_005905 [Neoechinorhynchus agilis]
MRRPPFVFDAKKARMFNAALVDQRAEGNSRLCSELRSIVPEGILSALHSNGADHIEMSSIVLAGDDQKSIGQNQNYVKGGLIYLPTTNSQFERFLKRTRGPVVIDFYARWLSEAIKKEKGIVKVVRVNVSKLPEIARQYDVSVTPTAVGVGCDGLEVSRLTGATDDQNIRHFVKEIVESCKKAKGRRSASADRYESDDFAFGHDRELKRSPMRQRPYHRYEKTHRRSRSEVRFPQNEKDQTHKQFFFTNEAISSKPLTMIPGIGQVYAARMEAHGIHSAKQLVGIYMQERNMVEFQNWLKDSFHMNERWARIATEAIETVVRHMV